MLKTYQNNHQLTQSLAQYLLQLSEEAIDSTGKFTIALSGGSALDLLGEAVASQQSRAKINAKSWHVFWADERCVPFDSKQSNYAAAKENLLDTINIPPSQVHPVNTALSPQEAAEDYEKKIAAVLGNIPPTMPRFDLIILGFGGDGHTASLFPHHKLIEEQSKAVASLDDSPKLPLQRVTLTLGAINNARNIAIIAAGREKYEIAISSDMSLPIKMVNPADGNLRWFVSESSN